MTTKKGILHDGRTKEPIHVGTMIYGTARFEDKSTVKFNGVQLIELLPNVFGVVFKAQTFTVLPREGCGEITRAYAHKILKA